LGELAKRRASRLGVVAALPGQLAAGVRRREPNRLNETSCPLMLGLIGIGVFDLRAHRHLRDRGRRRSGIADPGLSGAAVVQ
jgi:hypothetical protein